MSGPLIGFGYAKFFCLVSSTDVTILIFVVMPFSKV